MVVTNHSILKKLGEVNTHIQNNIKVTNSGGYSANEEDKVTFFEQEITKVINNTVITSDNVKAKLYNPLPCFFWKCIGVANNDGVIILEKPIRGLFLSDGEDTVCLGVDGDTNEFELRIVVGENEIRVNETFLNIVTKHLIINGLEADK